MRVCHFCTSTVDAPYFDNISKGLTVNGISVLCGNLYEGTTPRWVKEVPGVSYFDLGARTKRDYPRAVVRLARLLRRERIDILQTHLFDAGLIGLLAARLARTQIVVVTRHHLDQVTMTGTRAHQALDRWMAQRADRVVAVSNAVRDYMTSNDGIDGEQIEVVHLGFNFSALSPTEDDRRRVRAEFGFTDEFVLGYVASFFSTKGHRYLLAALRDLAKVIPKVRLLLVGLGDREEIEATIRKFGLEDRVVFAGYRRDAPTCMRAMDVVVHPSLSEAFSQVLIEGMAVGTPVVATLVGGAAEVVTDGETGMLVPPADDNAITQAVLKLYHDPELRRRIASAGQRSVRQRFTVERMVTQQIDCYRRLLSGSLTTENLHVRSQI